MLETAMDCTPLGTTEGLTQALKDLETFLSLLGYVKRLPDRDIEDLVIEDSPFLVFVEYGATLAIRRHECLQNASTAAPPFPVVDIVGQTIKLVSGSGQSSCTLSYKEEYEAWTFDVTLPTVVSAYDRHWAAAKSDLNWA